MQGSGEVMLGPSSSQLLHTLGAMYAQLLRPGDELVLQVGAPRKALRGGARAWLVQGCGGWVGGKAGEGSAGAAGGGAL